MLTAFSNTLPDGGSLSLGDTDDPWLLWGWLSPRPVPGWCFGRPRRHAQAAGCFALCLGLSLIVFVGNVGKIKHTQTAFLVPAGFLALAAILAYAGVPGALQRAAVRYG